EPSLDLVEIELEPLGLLLRQQRIEVAEPLDETPVARAAAVSDHDVIERPLLSARAGKTQFQGHFRSFPQLTLSSRPSEASARTQLASFACVARWVPDSALRAVRGDICCERNFHFFFPNPGNPPSPGGFGPPRPGRPPENCGGRPGIVGGKPGAPGPAGIPGGNPPGIFLASSAICSGLGMPPRPSMLAMAAIGPRLRPPPIAFITSAMLRCILSIRLMSSTLVPEPAAMRFLRLALRMSGFLRSFAVIESMIAI